jgi:hypothetical protein
MVRTVLANAIALVLQVAVAELHRHPDANDGGTGYPAKAA